MINVVNVRDGFNFHAMLPSVELEEFEDLELLGRGASAIVVSATHKRTRQTVAIRLILARKLLSPDYLFRELDVHRQISHPFIADFFGILTTDEYFVYCLELVENGSLLDKINATKGISEVEANKYFCQLMSAIRLLHEGLSVAHRDIKLENLLIDSRGNLKMIDFGFVSEQSKILRSVCGSAPYTAPEIIKGEAYTHQVDLWSAGVCLYGMFTGNLPFRPMHGKDLGRVIMEDEPEYPDVIPANAKDLIKGLLEKDPEKRMTMDGVRCHPWISESKYSTYISDDYLNLVTSTDAFDGSVLDGYPDIDPDSVERMIEVGAPDTDDSVTYRILKHVAKMRMPEFRGIVEPSQGPRSSRSCVGVETKKKVEVGKKRAQTVKKIKKREEPRSHITCIVPILGRRSVNCGCGTLKPHMNCRPTHRPGVLTRASTRRGIMSLNLGTLDRVHGFRRL